MHLQFLKMSLRPVLPEFSVTTGILYGPTDLLFFKEYDSFYFTRISWFQKKGVTSSVSKIIHWGFHSATNLFVNLFWNIYKILIQSFEDHLFVSPQPLTET